MYSVTGLSLAVKSSSCRHEAVSVYSELTQWISPSINAESKHTHIHHPTSLISQNVINIQCLYLTSSLENFRLSHVRFLSRLHADSAILIHLFCLSVCLSVASRCATVSKGMHICRQIFFNIC